MAVPTLATIAVGDKITAAYLTSIKTYLDFLAEPPRVKAWQSGSGQVFTTGTAAVVQYNSESWDTDSMHNTVTNNSRITIVTPGRYLFTGSVGWPSNSSGYRNAILLKNGAAVARCQAAASPTTNNTVQQVIGEDLAVAGDYYEVQAVQTSGGSLTLVTGVDYTWFSAVWTGN